MSTQFEQAIAREIADLHDIEGEPDESVVVVGYFLVAAYLTPSMDGSTGYFYGMPEAPHHHTLGLLTHAVDAYHHKSWGDE